MDKDLQDTRSRTETPSHCFVRSMAPSTDTSAIICHILASRSAQPNTFGAKIPVPTALKVHMSAHLLRHYDDKIVAEFLKYGWPINYNSHQSPLSTPHNHQSALAFADHVRHNIKTELSFGAIAGPFSVNPLSKPLICSPLQTVPKRGSSKRRVVMDLSFQPDRSVNSAIPLNTYLDSPFKLRLPGIDRLCELILSKGRGCLIYKKDLQRAYRQIPINPRDYHLLGFNFDNQFYFDTRCPFGLRTSAMICQRTTKAVIYIFTQSDFSADVYLDDFYGAEVPALANTAFATLQTLFDSLGLASSPEIDSPPAVEMVCLGILVNTEDLTLRVLDSWLRDLSDELRLWLSRERFTMKELQSLLGKLSFVTACVHVSRIFLSRLLNALRSFPSHAKHQPVTRAMRKICCGGTLSFPSSTVFRL